MGEGLGEGDGGMEEWEGEEKRREGEIGERVRERGKKKKGGKEGREVMYRSEKVFFLKCFTDNFRKSNPEFHEILCMFQ